MINWTKLSVDDLAALLCEFDYSLKDGWARVSNGIICYAEPVLAKTPHGVTAPDAVCEIFDRGENYIFCRMNGI